MYGEIWMGKYDEDKVEEGRWKEKLYTKTENRESEMVRNMRRWLVKGKGIASIIKNKRKKRGNEMKNRIKDAGVS